MVSMEVNPQKLSIKKTQYGHAVYLNGEELQGVYLVNIKLEVDSVPRVTLVMNTPLIDCEYDHEVYSK